MGRPQLALYVHLPWCIRKCPYCDFNSFRIDGAVPEAAYVDALIRDLDRSSEALGRRVLDSIFFGGGTPSLFRAASLARLLERVAVRFNLPDDVEITLEANPGSAEAQRFREFRAIGINRLSVGVQSFRDEQLGALGRVHDGKEALRALAAAIDAGFHSINADLMYGLPGDSLAGSLEDLETAARLGLPHLSWYQLTIEPGTVFERAPPALPEDEVIGAIETQGLASLSARGYHRYEISAHARAGHQCRHNRNYWEFGDYLGIGAGAHGKLSDERGGIRRTRRVRHPARYLEAAGSPRCETVETCDGAARRISEFMLSALRLTGGFPIALFEARTGLRYREVEPAIARCIDEGLLVRESERLRPSAFGVRFLNDLLVLIDREVEALHAPARAHVHSGGVVIG
jgi:oxygen-independent coproporphyrinogen-3 oxidase